MSNTTDTLTGRIHKHGMALLHLFPHATETDPDRLCRLLRLIEVRAHRAAEDACNGHINQAERDEVSEDCRLATCALLGIGTAPGCPVWVNGDPRGCALKINNKWLMHRDHHLPTDLGGYGLIAPDLRD